MRAAVLALVLAACGTDGAVVSTDVEQHVVYPCVSNAEIEGDRLPAGSEIVSARLCDPGTDDCDDITADAYLTTDRRIHAQCEKGRTLRLTWLEPDPPLDTGAFD